jgi:hypothetical protein
MNANGNEWASVKHTHRLLFFITSILTLLLIVFGLHTIRVVQQERRDDALIAAIKRHDSRMVSFWLREGANPNALDTGDDHKTVWQIILDDVLRTHRSRPATHDKPQTPAIFLTVPECDVEIARLLLQYGVDINTMDDSSQTPLMLTLTRLNLRYDIGGDAPMPPWEPYVQLLVESGANVNLAYKEDPDWLNQEGQTPLHKAAYIGDEKLVVLLLAHGADVNARDTGGGTPLMDAARHGHAEAVEALLKGGTDVHMHDSEGHTALFYAQEEDKDWSNATTAHTVQMLQRAEGKRR